MCIIIPNYFNVHPFKCIYSEITPFYPTQSHLTLHLIIVYMTFVGLPDLISRQESESISAACKGVIFLCFYVHFISRNP